MQAGEASSGARSTPSDIPGDRRGLPKREANMPHDSSCFRTLAFAAADLLFLLLVATASTAAMHAFHEFHWNLAVTIPLGMVAAMAVQTLLAIAISPILGSIESMVPSMLVAMTSPMVICALDLLGLSVPWWGCLGLGAAVGGLIYIAVQCYAWSCRRRLNRLYQTHYVNPVGL